MATVTWQIHVDKKKQDIALYGSKTEEWITWLKGNTRYYLANKQYNALGALKRCNVLYGNKTTKCII